MLINMSRTTGANPAAGNNAPLAALAVFLAIVIAATAVALLGQPLPDPTATATPENVAKLIEAQRTEMTRLQQLLVFLAGVGVVYALVQGLFAFLTVEAFSKKARELHSDYEKDLELSRKRLEERTVQLERFEERVNTRYPVFANMDSGLRSRFSELQRVCQRVGLARNRYSLLSESEHQTIAYLERALPLLEAIEPAGSGETVSILTRLSAYYLAQAKHWERDRAEQVAESMARSRFLLERAAEHNPVDHRLLNERAHRIMFGFDPKYAERTNEERYAAAFDVFLESLRRYPRQRCALYNLAWIDDERGDLTVARQRLEEALEFPHWETEGDLLYARASSVSYNLACCLARLAVRDGNRENELLEQATKQLEDCVNSYPEERTRLKEDLERGELRSLTEEPALLVRVQTLVERVHGKGTKLRLDP